MTDTGIDLDDYSDVMILTTILVGTTHNQKINDVIRLQKMAFLIDKIIADKDLDDDLDFGAEKFGPFSENLEESIDMLSSWGILVSSKSGKSKTTILTKDGNKLLLEIEKKYPGIVNLSKQLNSDLENISTNELVKLIYRLYPSYTVNSLIKDELVNSTRIDSFTIDFFDKSKQTIVTENGCKLEVSFNNDKIIIGGDMFA